MILITGGAGFIGSVIAAFLETAGHDIAVCDRLGTDERWRNIAKRDLADVIAPEDLPGWLARHGRHLEGIVHMGAISATTERDADLIRRTNLALSQELWAVAGAQSIPFIYASSAATYGDGSAGFRDGLAALPALRPMNAYGWSKHAFDRWVARQLREGRRRPPQWAGLKFFNVYGPNEYHKGPMRSVVHQITPKAAAGETVTLFRSHNPAYPDGGQLRDFVHVKDCAAVVAWLFMRPGVSGLFNLGTGTARSFRDLAHATFAACNRAPDMAFIDMPVEIRDRYQYFTQADMTALREAGYHHPFLSLEDGIADYVRHHLLTDDPYL